MLQFSLGTVTMMTTILRSVVRTIVNDEKNKWKLLNFTLELYKKYWNDNRSMHTWYTLFSLISFDKNEEEKVKNLWSLLKLENPQSSNKKLSTIASFLLRVRNELINDNYVVISSGGEQKQSKELSPVERTISLLSECLMLFLDQLPEEQVSKYLFPATSEGGKDSCWMFLLTSFDDMAPCLTKILTDFADEHIWTLFLRVHDNIDRLTETLRYVCALNKSIVQESVLNLFLFTNLFGEIKQKGQVASACALSSKNKFFFNRLMHHMGPKAICSGIIENKRFSFFISQNLTYNNPWLANWCFEQIKKGLSLSAARVLSLYWLSSGDFKNSSKMIDMFLGEELSQEEESEPNSQVLVSVHDKLITASSFYCAHSGTPFVHIQKKPLATRVQQVALKESIDIAELTQKSLDDPGMLSTPELAKRKINCIPELDVTSTVQLVNEIKEIEGRKLSEGEEVQAVEEEIPKKEERKSGDYNEDGLETARIKQHEAKIEEQKKILEENKQDPKEKIAETEEQDFNVHFDPFYFVDNQFLSETCALISLVNSEQVESKNPKGEKEKEEKEKEGKEKEGKEEKEKEGKEEKEKEGEDPILPTNISSLFQVFCLELSKPRWLLEPTIQSLILPKEKLIKHFFKLDFNQSDFYKSTLLKNVILNLESDTTSFLQLVVSQLLKMAPKVEEPSYANFVTEIFLALQELPPSLFQAESILTDLVDDLMLTPKTYKSWNVKFDVTLNACEQSIVTFLMATKKRHLREKEKNKMRYFTEKIVHTICKMIWGDLIPDLCGPPVAKDWNLAK